MFSGVKLAKERGPSLTKRITSKPAHCKLGIGDGVLWGCSSPSPPYFGPYVVPPGLEAKMGRRGTDKGSCREHKIPVKSGAILGERGGHQRPLLEEAPPDNTKRISPWINSINRQMIY